MSWESWGLINGETVYNKWILGNEVRSLYYLIIRVY